MKKVHVFRVQGYGGFPLDMLRYDSCWPSTVEDAEELGESVKHGHHSGSRKSNIELASNKAPTRRRWQSFGWVVVEVSR